MVPAGISVPSRQALYRNECREGQEVFLHASAAAGLGNIPRNRVCWGTGFLDLDHHGWEDLFLTAGDIYLHSADVPRSQPPVLLRNRGDGQFQDISALGGPYFQTSHIGRGAVLADFDNDGRIDLAVSHLNEPVALLRNEAGTCGRHWLGVQLQGAGHRDVVGARVILEAGGRRQTRFAKGGGSYFSSPDRRHVFGLGAADRVDGLRCLAVGAGAAVAGAGRRSLLAAHRGGRPGGAALPGPLRRTPAGLTASAGGGRPGRACLPCSGWGRRGENSTAPSKVGSRRRGGTAASHWGRHRFPSFHQFFSFSLTGPGDTDTERDNREFVEDSRSFARLAPS
jgi:hypothetical protein